MENTERKICDAMLSLMKEKPFDKIKVTEVANMAHISRSTFYMYYDSLYDALQALEDDFIAHFIDEKEVGIQIDNRQVIDNFAYVRDHMDIFDVLTGANGDPSFTARMTNRSKRILAKIAKESHSSLNETQIMMINQFTMSGKIQLFRWWSEHKNEISVNEIIYIMELLNQSINEIVTQ